MNTIKMEIINIDGKKITKNIPIELVSDYMAIGWKKVEEEVKKEKSEFSFSSKSSFKDTKDKK